MKKCAAPVASWMVFLILCSERVTNSQHLCFVFCVVNELRLEDKHANKLLNVPRQERLLAARGDPNLQSNVGISP
eukprot:8890371-Heterocapsa_arctica.AAC.1